MSSTVSLYSNNCIDYEYGKFSDSFWSKTTTDLKSEDNKFYILYDILECKNQINYKLNCPYFSFKVEDLFERHVASNLFEDYSNNIITNEKSTTRSQDKIFRKIDVNALEIDLIATIKKIELLSGFCLSHEQGSSSFDDYAKIFCEHLDQENRIKFPSYKHDISISLQQILDGLIRQRIFFVEGNSYYISISKESLENLSLLIC